VVSVTDPYGCILGFLDLEGTINYLLFFGEIISRWNNDFSTTILYLGNYVNNSKCLCFPEYVGRKYIYIYIYKCFSALY
jgi:hypothetical protein